jgi:hypothetical protein
LCERSFIFFGGKAGDEEKAKYDDTADLRSRNPASWRRVIENPLVGLIHYHHPSSSSTGSEKMKIAVLTSGGDSAGMNAVVRGVVRAGIVKFATSFSSFYLPITPGPLFVLRSLSSTAFTEDARLGSFAKDTKAWSAEMTKTCNSLRTITPRY